MMLERRRTIPYILKKAFNTLLPRNPFMTTTKLFLVRHGQTTWNKKGINHGWTQGTLSNLGKKQAELLAKRMAREKIDFIYASDLGRVRQTLAPLRKLRPDIPVILTPALREQNLGVYEGTPRGTIEEARRTMGATRWRFKIEGGETIRQHYGRVAKFLKETLPKHRGQTIALFSHGGTTVQVTKHYLKFPNKVWREYHPSNASFHILEIKKKKASLIVKNENSHLGAYDTHKNAVKTATK